MVKQYFTAHQGYITGAGQMPLCIKTAGIDKVGACHAQLCGAGIHLLGKGSLAAADIFSHRHGGIVGARNADRLEHLLQRHLFPRLQPDLAAAHMVGVFTDRDSIVKPHPARLQRFKGQQQRHDLGDRGNGAAVIGVLFI